MLLPALLAALQVPVPGEADETGETLVLAPRSQAAATESATTRTVVTGEELRATGERSLPRALGRAAGVWIQETNLGGGSAFLRGVTGNQVLILVDGVRVNDATTRFGPNQSLNTIDPSIVERVEVTLGPSSVLYGSDAVGGVIHVWTKRRRPVEAGGAAGLEAALGLDYQSAARGGRAFAEVSGAAGSDAWLGVLSGQDWDDLEAGGGERQEFTGYGGGAAFGAWEHALGDGRSLRFTSRYNRDHDVPRTDRLTPGFGPMGPVPPSDDQFEFELQERQAHVLAYTDEEPGWADRMQVRVWYKRYREDRERMAAGSTVQRRESDEVQTVGVAADWRKAAGEDHLLTFGFDLANDQVDSSRVDVDMGVATPKDGAFAPDSCYTSFGAFVQDELFALEPWDVTLGLRWSAFDWSADAFPSQVGSTDESGDFDALTASVAAAREVADGVRLSASIAQGFRAPNLDELAKDGTFSTGDELHNPDLDPERSLTYELAADVDRARWSTGLALYYTDIEDVVGRQLVDPGGPGVDPTFLRQNQGRVVVLGAEWRGRTRLGGADGPWSADSRLAWQRGQQYDDTVDPSSGTTPLYDVPWRRVPPLHGSAALRWARPGELPFDRAAVELRFADRQDRLHPDDLTDRRIDPNGTPGWAALDVSVGGPLGSAEGGSWWSVGLHNVLDERYRVHGSGFDAPGRNLVLQVEWRP